MSTGAQSLRLVPLTGMPEVEPAADLAALVLAAAARAETPLANGALVVCQKIVSKAEGRFVALADVEPSDEARRIRATSSWCSANRSAWCGAATAS
jgi:coenzyme F420-0:L-glutamate ligase/coenzyme F420-1:gamma-L-glutamate ligase